MKLVSAAAIAAALVAGTLAAAPAVAAPKPAKEAEAPGRKYNISPDAKKPLSDLQKAVTAKDEAAYPAALAAAQAVAKTSDDKYIVAKLTLQHAEQANDAAARLAAYQAVLASGGADAAEVQAINHNMSIVAATSGNWAVTEATLTPIVAANPNDLDNTINLARAKIELKKDAEALTLLQRAIQLSNAAGKPAPESWYKSALSIAYNSRNNAAVSEIDAALVKAYPTPENFKNAIVLYRASGTMPSNADLDLLRLLRASGTATGKEYVYLASIADQAGLPGEVKSALDEARAKGAVTGGDGAQLLATNSSKVAADRASLAGDEAKARAAATGTLALNTGNAYYGYGDYAKAADLFRLALQKGGIDAGTANLRLGEALAMSRDRAGAEAAFRAVTGPRAQLANLWITWLAMRG
jgi:hypothetical protein